MATKRGTNSHRISSETPVFSEKEKTLMKILLDYGHRDPDRWVDFKRIAERLYAGEKTGVDDPADAARSMLRRVEQKLASIDVEVRQTTSSAYRTLVFSINPEDESKIEEVCGAWRPRKNEKLTALYIGELGFGTVGYDPRAGKGLGYFLKFNKEDGKKRRDCLDAVILNGGLIPFVPEFYTVTAAHSMRLLAKKSEGVAELDDKQAEERIAQVLKSSDIDDTLKDFFKKHVAGKILTKTDAAKTARAHLEEMLGSDFKGEVHYAYGDEDRSNIKQLEEIEIVRLMKKGEEYQRQLKAFEKEKKTWQKERGNYLHEKEMLDNMLMWLTRAVDYKGSEFKENVAAFVKHHENEITALDKVSKNLGKNVLSILNKASSKREVEKKIKEAQDHFKKVQSKIAEVDSQEQDVTTRINAVAREAEASGFFHITKRVQLDAEQEALLFKMVSQRYQKLIYEALGHKQAAVHPERRRDIELKDRMVRLEHSMNIRSDNPEKDALARQKEQSALANKRGERVPDVYLTAHGEGMRHQPQAKERETIVKGEYRETPEINMLVKLGTFHSKDKLEYLLRNDVTKNWQVKRYHNTHASGAMIHTLLPDGTQRLECLPTENLIELGMVGEKLEESYAAVKSAKGNEKKELEAKIEKLEASLSLRDPKKEDTIKVTILTDAHIGSPTWPGRPSNYALMEAAIKYEETGRLPDVLVLTEMLHGAMRKPFYSDKETIGLVRPEYERAIQNITTDTSITADEKIKLLAQLALMKDEQTPVPSIDDQARIFDDKVAPFVKKVIANGGMVVIASGNHAQKTTDGSTDEATSLARAFSPVEQNSIYVLHAKGTSFGAGSVSLKKFNDERNVYVAHRMRRGSDEVTGLKEQAKGMNLKDALVLAGDVHHAACEYADGTAFVIGAGLQSWNPFPDEIGKQGSLRGIVDVYLSRNPKLNRYFRVDYVLDPSLEDMVKDRIEIERKLIEKYIPTR